MVGGGPSGGDTSPEQAQPAGVDAPAVLDALDEHIAVLGRDGVILAANEAWRQFARTCDPAGPDTVTVRGNFLEAWRASSPDGTARTIADGIAAVLAGDRARFSLEYPHGGATSRRWLRLTVRPLSAAQSGAVVSRADITEQKHAEQRIAAQYAAGRVLSGASSVEAAMPDLLGRVCEALEWDAAAYWAPDVDGRALYCRSVWHRPGHGMPPPLTEHAPGAGLAGLAWTAAAPVWIEDLAQRPDLPHAEVMAAAGLHTALAFPVRADSGVLGVIELFTTQILAEDPALVLASQALGRQIGRFAEHAHAVNALREGRERERAHFKSLPIPTFTWQRAGDSFVLVDFNDAAEALTGAVATLIGAPFHDAYRDTPEAQAAFDDAIATGVPVARELRMRIKPDGDERILASRFVWMPPDMVTVYLEDITERRQAEEALRQSEERFRLLAENAQDLMYRYRLKPAPRFEYLSPSVVTMTGYTPEEFYADATLGGRLVHADDLALVRAMMLSPEHIGDPLLVRWTRKDGAVIWVEQHNRAIADDAGDHAVVEGIIRDVTARVEVEEALRRSEERFRSLIQNASEVIAIIDRDNTIRYISPTVERVLGYAPLDLLGSDLRTAIHPDDVAPLLEVLSEPLQQSGTQPVVEARLRHQDGSWRHLEIVASNLRHDPNIDGIVINARDITERKQFEEELAYQAFW